MVNAQLFIMNNLKCNNIHVGWEYMRLIVNLKFLVYGVSLVLPPHATAERAG